MPKYHIVAERKFTIDYGIDVEADNEELAMDNANVDHVQSCTVDRYEIEEVIDVGSIVERFGTKDE